MIKRIAALGLAKGRDTDEAWEYLTKIYAPSIARQMPELRKYVLNRAVEPWPELERMNEPDGGVIGGKPRWWSISEQWFDSLEDCVNSVAAIQADKEWSGYVGEKLGAAIVESEVLINTEVPRNHVKRMGFFGLRPGKDADEGWTYWKDVHAENWRTTSPGCSLYRINRAKETPWGRIVWWGFLEQIFESVDACNNVMRHPRPQDNFHEYMCDTDLGMGYCEEVIVV